MLRDADNVMLVLRGGNLCLIPQSPCMLHTYGRKENGHRTANQRLSAHKTQPTRKTRRNARDEALPGEKRRAGSVWQPRGTRGGDAGGASSPAECWSQTEPAAGAELERSEERREHVEEEEEEEEEERGH
ncbi:uncharacterized protein LOC135105903 isoform X5 [Scylla paramamosain]|uniref:uncharacterized protein LOC135105903 isoform X5 n=1 Tax=Scylla paramamosain TaxID=85552 RepID=UPI003082B193